MKVTNETWQQFATSIATQREPLLNSPAAMERYHKHMQDYIFHVRVPHGKYKAINNCELIDFIDEASKARYTVAEDKYIEACNRVGKEAGSGPLVEFTIFRKAAEQEKASIKADRMFEAVEGQGKAAIAACCYRGTVARIVKRLVNVHKVPRSRIALIWGGDDTFSAKKMTFDEIKKVLRDIALGNKIPRKVFKTLEHQINLEVDEQDKEGFVGLELGTQSRQARQIEIDKFQTGQALYCCYTLAAGGTGLSLLHTDISTFGKPVNLRPRRTFVTPSYSERDLIQSLGRAHRTVFSLSDTYQTILFFRNTIEEHVMARVGLKLMCASKMLLQKESWIDSIYQYAVNRGMANKQLQDDKVEIEKMLRDSPVGSEDIELIDNGSEEDEDEDSNN